tara:strand:- start:22375 stop:23025 length:651 start_codon:yes stop_codon:yes gene_type:complete
MSHLEYFDFGKYLKKKDPVPYGLIIKKPRYRMSITDSFTLYSLTCPIPIKYLDYVKYKLENDYMFSCNADIILHEHPFISGIDYQHPFYSIQSRQSSLVQQLFKIINGYLREAQKCVDNNYTMHYPIFKKKAYDIEDLLKFVIKEYNLSRVLTRVDRGEENISTLILSSSCENNVHNAYTYLIQYHHKIFLSNNNIASVPKKNKVSIPKKHKSISL